MADQLKDTLVGVSGLDERLEGCEQDALPPLPPVLKIATLEYSEQLAFTRQEYTVLGSKPVNTKLVVVVAGAVIQVPEVFTRYCTW